jgi:hypothetical protein
MVKRYRTPEQLLHMYAQEVEKDRDDYRSRAHVFGVSPGEFVTTRRPQLGEKQRIGIGCRDGNGDNPSEWWVAPYRSPSNKIAGEDLCELLLRFYGLK